jgi:soluble lytic murein transglycosylase-like protein
MQAALELVSHRYRVSADALGPIFEAAQLTGRERHLDPLLIIAVIAIESRFNPFAESPMGAQGLMQVVPRFHQDKLPEGAGRFPLFNPVTNVQVGTQVLQESIRRNGGLMPGLQQFGGAVDDEEQAYAAKVLAEKQRLEQAARGGRESV